MAGIISYGVYVPYYRLDRAEISKAWRSAPMRGEKAIANFDEDSVTMAVAAGHNCLKGFDKKQIDALYLASTTFPYHEKMSATIVAGALGLNREVVTADFANSLRGGTTALRMAVNIVDGGSVRNVLVICSDCREGYPKGRNEMLFGDGAAALIVGHSGVAVKVEGMRSTSEEFLGTWRTAGERFIRQCEERFARDKGYTDLLPKAILETLSKYNVRPEDISKAAFYGADVGQQKLVGKKVGFDLNTQLQDPLVSSIGDTGAPGCFMILVSAMEDAKPDEELLLASYGDGCDVFVLKTTNEIERIKGRRGVKHYLKNKKTLNDYMKYILWRNLMPTEPPARPPQPMVSVPALFRDRDWGLPLRGVKCLNCGTIQFPVQRVCVKCQSKDRFEPYEFGDKIGKLTTFSHDNLAASIDPPTTVCAIDFDEGGRIMCDMTDRDVDAVKVGMKVEMTFRKLHTVGGIHNYYWKCMPYRE